MGSPGKDLDQGAAAVEFALVAVPLMMMLMALIYGGIIFGHQASVSSAAREGARMMAITNDVVKAKDAARDGYALGTLTDDQIDVVGSCPAPPDRSSLVQVIVTVDPSFSVGPFSSPDLTGVGAMRCGG